MDGQVHPAEVGGGLNFFLTMDGEFCRGIFLMFRYEAGGLDEHTAGTAGGIQDTPVERFEHFDEKSDDAAGSVEFAAFLSFRAGKLAEEIFVNSAEGVVIDGYRNFGYFFE